LNTGLIIVSTAFSFANIQRKQICCAKKQEKNEGKLEKVFLHSNYDAIANDFC
jgi:hypothetical protein